MKTFSSILLICTLAVPSFAQDAKTNAAPEQGKTTQTTITIPASAGELSAPMVLKDGNVSQPEKTELPAGGKAVYSFTVPTAGDYVIQALVKGESEDSNSFYANVDAQPEDPLMIWDFDVTNGFQKRTVNWRGNGSAEADEFTPKRFKLAAGAHKLIIMGREPAELKNITIRPAAD